MKVPGRKDPSTRQSGEGGELKLSSSEEGEAEERGEGAAMAWEAREEE